MTEAAQRAQATAAQAAAKAAQFLAEAGLCDHRLYGSQPGGPSQASWGSVGGGYAYQAGAAVAAMENSLGSGGGSWHPGNPQRAGCVAPGLTQGVQCDSGSCGGSCPSPGRLGGGTGRVMEGGPLAGGLDGMVHHGAYGTPVPPFPALQAPGPGQYGSSLWFQHVAGSGENPSASVAGLGGGVPREGGGGGGLLPAPDGGPGAPGAPAFPIGGWLDSSSFLSASTVGLFAVGNFVEIVTLDENLALDGTALFRISGMYQPSTLGILLEVGFRGASAIPRSVEFGIAFGSGSATRAALHLCSRGRDECNQPALPGRQLLHVDKARIRRVIGLEEPWIKLEEGDFEKDAGGGALQHELTTQKERVAELRLRLKTKRRESPQDRPDSGSRELVRFSERGGR